MEQLWPFVVATHYVVTIVSSGFNAWYFGVYRSASGRRRVGAAVMAVVCGATFAESLLYGLSLVVPLEVPPLHWGPWLLSRSLVLVGSLLVSLLILRQLGARQDST